MLRNRVVHRSLARSAAFCVLALVLLRGAGPLRSQSHVDAGAVFVGAGDIASCADLAPAHATARILDRLEGTIFTLGDHAYKRGDATELRECYGPTWGKYKARTRPTIGNHDVQVGHGKAYFDYFGDNAGPDRRGYYSFDLATWHLISLNSNAPLKRDSAQMTWLRADLAEHRNECILAYWHVPLFSSGSHQEPTMLEAWRALYEAGADVVLNGHDHLYERFAPQDPSGQPDPTRGIREFIVGTGGGELEPIRRTLPNSEVRNDHTLGVLKLTLGAGRYSWEFIPVPGSTFRDTGSGTCSPAR